MTIWTFFIHYIPSLALTLFYNKANIADVQSENRAITHPKNKGKTTKIANISTLSYGKPGPTSSKLVTQLPEVESIYENVETANKYM